MANKEIKTIIIQAKHEQESNWLKACQTLLKGLKLYPHEKKFFDELGNIYFKKEAFREAADYYTNAHLLDRADVDIIYKIAYCYLIAKDFELAIQYFDLISDSVPEAAYNKCVALYRLNQGFKAMEILEELTDSYQYSDKPFILLGKLYLEFERYDRAIDLISKAGKYFSIRGELSYIRGAAYFYSKRWLKAYLDLVQAENSALQTPVYYRMYALTCERIGKTEKAISLLKKCIDEHPAYYGSYYDLIKIYTAHNRYNNALLIVDKLYQMGVTLFDISGKEGDLFDSIFESEKGSTS